MALAPETAEAKHALRLSFHRRHARPCWRTLLHAPRDDRRHSTHSTHNHPVSRPAWPKRSSHNMRFDFCRTQGLLRWTSTLVHYLSNWNHLIKRLALIRRPVEISLQISA